MVIFATGSWKIILKSTYLLRWTNLSINSTSWQYLHKPLIDLTDLNDFQMSEVGLFTAKNFINGTLAQRFHLVWQSSIYFNKEITSRSSQKDLAHLWLTILQIRKLSWKKLNIFDWLNYHDPCKYVSNECSCLVLPRVAALFMSTNFNQCKSDCILVTKGLSR